MDDSFQSTFFPFPKPERHGGQDVAEKPKINSAHRLPPRRREFQHSHSSSRPAHPRHLPQSSVRVRYVPQAERIAHDLKRIIREREPLSVGLDECQPSRLARTSRLPPRQIQHFMAKI